MLQIATVGISPGEAMRILSKITSLGKFDIREILISAALLSVPGQYSRRITR